MMANGFVLALSVIIMLISASGCAQNEFAHKRPSPNVDCRSCHALNGAEGAREFSSIYADPRSHHPVGVSYPLGATAYPKFNPPSGESPGIAFFDRNDNGQPESNEIQLFGMAVRVTVECASCHKAHGNVAVFDSAPPTSFYLRIANVGSALCITCHRQ
jgi:hypothetical protein